MDAKADAGGAKPRLALAIATGLGLGYVPKAPGTFGSLAGILLTGLAIEASALSTFPGTWGARIWGSPAIARSNFLLIQCGLVILISSLGVWAAHRVAEREQAHDPQIVVIDEVSGQLIAYLGLATTATFALNWKYLLAGFILFRVFDIWKPFPARHAESFPGGLGIMADDWIAGLYAALALWLARQLGL
jgi:phosphatidylglycerophosphatase A